MSRFIIRNGKVVDPSSSLDRIGDVVVEDGIVREIGVNIADPGGSELFDATGMVVAPGFIDIHVHLREPGFEHAETIESGSRAAAAGGFTSVCCMPNTQPVNDNATVTNYIRAQAERYAVVNVYPIGAITKNSAGEELSAIASMKAAGAVAISDDGKPVMNAQVARRAMEFARALDIPLVEHCEDLHLSAGGDMHEGLQSTRLGLRGIPRSSEDVMVARDLILAELTGCRYHVAHISSYLSVDMVRFAKSRGLRVTAEATPHHFAIADSNMPPYDSSYKMKPPLRETCDVEAVIEGLADGTIDAIATDHAPHPGAEKMQEFERCPFGIIGLETALSLALERLYHTGKVNMTRLVELFTTNPARIMSLPRGTLQPGAVADLTIFGTDHEWIYDVNRSPSKSRNTPFHGHKFRGGPLATIVGGKLVWKFNS
jgi:dihydroorotase